METEKKVLRADRYIRQHEVTDEDMKQDIYLASLMSDTPQAFSRRAKAILMSAEEASTKVEEVSLEEMLENASTEDEALSLMALVCEEQEQRDLKQLRLDVLAKALNEAADRLVSKRSRDTIKCRLEGMSLREMSDYYNRSAQTLWAAEMGAMRHMRRAPELKELLALLLEL